MSFIFSFSLFAFIGREFVEQLTSIFDVDQCVHNVGLYESTLYSI
jgi:hypothetical protein